MTNKQKNLARIICLILAGMMILSVATYLIYMVVGII